MGYILPIQQDTYRNYQYRIYNKDRTPHEIKAVRTVKFIPIREDVDFFKQHQKAGIKRNGIAAKSERLASYKITPSEEQELSGKGHHVNMKV